MVACAVSSCKSSNDKRLKRNLNRIPGEVKFFRFPRDDAYKKIWLNSCARKDSNVNVRNLYICSLHFTPEDYARNLMHELLNYSPKNSKKLKRDAIPTLNMTPSDPEESVAEKRTMADFPEELGESVNQANGAVNQKNVFEGCVSNIISAQNIAHTTTIDGTSLQTNALDPSVTVNELKTSRTVDNVRQITTSFNLKQDGNTKWHEMRLKLLDHVLLIWLNRARCRDPKITGRKVFIKEKAKEVADILGTYILRPNKWLYGFRKKIKRKQSWREKLVLSKKSLNIRDIIAEETPHFFYEGDNLSDTSDAEEVNHNEMLRDEDAPEEEEILGNLIETYEDALNCLKMVEDYALCVRNLKAVSLISKMEEVLRNRQY